MSASESDILAAVNPSLAIDLPLSSQPLMGRGALLVTPLRSDCRTGLADEYQLWLAQISMKVCSS